MSNLWHFHSVHYSLNSIRNFKQAFEIEMRFVSKIHFWRSLTKYLLFYEIAELKNYYD